MSIRLGFFLAGGTAQNRGRSGGWGLEGNRLNVIRQQTTKHNSGVSDIDIEKHAT